MLRYLRKRLDIGVVAPSGESAYTFYVIKLEKLLQLIEIFDKKALNTHKYLDYLAWRKAILLYDYYKKNFKIIEDKEKILRKILGLKYSMNTRRTNFDLPERHTIEITPYWLLGFSEGESCFSVKKKKNRFWIKFFYKLNF